MFVLIILVILMAVRNLTGGEVVQVRTQKCDPAKCTFYQGTAFSIGKVGGKSILLTAKHNIPKGHGTVTIKHSGQRHTVDHVYSHPQYDVAILESSGVHPSCFTLLTQNPPMGTRLRAWGFPGGTGWKADGVRYRVNYDQGCYSITVPTRYGASGGPVTVGTSSVAGLISFFDPNNGTSGVVGADVLYSVVVARYGRVPDCNGRWQPDPPKPEPEPPQVDLGDVNNRIDKLLLITERQQGTIKILIDRTDSAEDERDSLRRQIADLQAEVERMQTIETPINVYYPGVDTPASVSTRILQGEPIDLHFEKLEQ